jgi:hypothetical protein
MRLWQNRQPRRQSRSLCLSKTDSRRVTPTAALGRMQRLAAPRRSCHTSNEAAILDLVSRCSAAVRTRANDATVQGLRQRSGTSRARQAGSLHRSTREGLSSLRTDSIVMVEGVRSFQLIEKSGAGFRTCPIHPAVGAYVTSLVDNSADGFLIPSRSRRFVTTFGGKLLSAA